jgi:predicted permease
MNHVTLLGQGEPEQIQGTMVSYNLFPMLGVRMLQGRGFDANDERQESRVVLISEDIWKRKFNSDTGVVGHAIRIGPLAFTVIGIVPRKQSFPQWADIWLPLSLAEPMLRDSRRFRPLEVVARLKDGISVPEARAELGGISSNLARTYPATNRNTGSRVILLRDSATMRIRPALVTAWIAVNLVLLMACANVAHLLLVRTASRERELAIRASLGASPRQLIGLLSAESAVIIGLGALIGSVLAIVGLPILRKLAATQVPRIEELRFDPAVWFYTVGVMIVLGFLMALPSFIRILHANLSIVARQGDVRALARSRGRLGSILMASEIGMAFFAFTVALLLVHSFFNLIQVPQGFKGKDVLAVNVVLPMTTRGWEESAQIFDTRLAPELENIPGVQTVAEANVAPMGLDEAQISRFSTRIAIPAAVLDPAKTPSAQVRWVSADYFQALGIPLLSGETLRQSDRGKGRYLINQTLAQRFFATQNPVGKRLVVDADTSTPTVVEIAGVVGDVRDLGLDIPVQPMLYRIDTSPVLTLFLRFARDPSSSITSVRNAIRKSNPDVSIGKIQGLDDVVANSLARYRFALWLMVGFAILAAVLSAVGVYAVVAVSVGQRMREFGIRSALGAHPVHLAALVLNHGLRVSIAGLGFGLVLTWIFSRALRSVLFEVGSVDPLALIAAAVLLLSLCIASMLVPAARASATVPAAILRQE